MKKSKFFAIIATALLVSCSSNDVVDESPAISENQSPIGFSVQKQNITRAQNLEDVNHYNFGVWAYKVSGKNSAADALVMDNYLVGYSDGTGKGYDKSNATTWDAEPGTTADHTSPWFYEKLGTEEYTYTGDAGFYKNTDTDYMSKNANQYLRYWDLAYTYTNFYCYSPYDADVTFTKDATTSKMTFGGANTIRDGYEETVNSAYASFDRSLSEFMFAGVKATNSQKADVKVSFKHMGAQLYIRFYEDIPGYKVELIDLGGDNGTMATGTTDDMAKGIQAAPASVSGTTYSGAQYYKTSGAVVSFTETDIANPSLAADWTGGTLVGTPLMFKVPQSTELSTKATAPANLTAYPENTTNHYVIQEKLAEGTQKYSYSPTIYYPVAQPTNSSTGFTFHVSYRIIAEDNKEVITVHNATVFVPANIVDGSTTTYITAWQPNTKYTYTFKITRGSSGTTDPGTAIDPTDPTPSTTKSLFPIVFDSATIEEYTETFKEYEISSDTSY